MQEPTTLKRATATVFAAGMLLAGAQDLNSESEFDFTSRRAQATLRVPISERNSLFPFCVLDLETTGFHTGRDSIIEIAILRVDLDGERIYTTAYSFLVRPPRTIPRKISELTGITNEMVAEAEGIDKVVPKVKDIVGDLPVVAHSASFDRRFLERKANLMNLSFARNEWICTLQMAKRAWPSRVDHKLSSFAIDLGMPEQTHRALADCEITLEVYLQAYDALAGDFTIKPVDKSEANDRDDTQQPEYDADLSKDVFVFSGFRDDVLAARIENCGGTIKSSISRKVTQLLVESKEFSSGKVKKAKEYDITVLTKTEFTQSFYQPASA